MTISSTNASFLSSLTRSMVRASSMASMVSRTWRSRQIILKNAGELTQRRKGVKTQGFRLMGTFTRWVSRFKYRPPHFPALCLMASWHCYITICSRAAKDLTQRRRGRGGTQSKEKEKALPLCVPPRPLRLCVKADFTSAAALPPCVYGRFCGHGLFPP